MDIRIPIMDGGLEVHDDSRSHFLGPASRRYG